MIRGLFWAAAAASILACMAAPLLYFGGVIAFPDYRRLLLAASFVWFASAARLAAGFQPGRRQSGAGSGRKDG